PLIESFCALVLRYAQTKIVEEKSSSLDVEILLI
ncbi:MAG: hypothetical protein ACI9GZ_004234, partial [Bacteroidia bacterium]